MFTLSSDGIFARISTFVAIAPNSAIYNEWQFDGDDPIPGPSASHVFDDPGWHIVCMRSCSGTSETQVCSAVAVGSYVPNAVTLSVVSAGTTQGVESELIQVCLSSVCPPPYYIDLQALSTESCDSLDVPDTVWSSLIPRHAFHDPLGNTIQGLTLDGTEIAVDDVVVGYQACGCFSYIDDLPGSVVIAANYEPVCEICRIERPPDSIRITNARAGGIFEYVYDDAVYAVAGLPVPSAGYFGSDTALFTNDTVIIAKIDQNGNSIVPVVDAINELTDGWKAIITLYDQQSNRGVSGITTGFVENGEAYTVDLVNMDFVETQPVDGDALLLTWELSGEQPGCTIDVDLSGDGEYVELLKSTVPYIFLDPIVCLTYGGEGGPVYLLALPEDGFTELTVFSQEEIDALNGDSYLYVGYDGYSGYAAAANGYVKELTESGADVQWMTVDKSSFPPSRPYNTVILHTPPSNWKMLTERYADKWDNCRIIGNTVWETEKILPEWVENANNHVDEIWLPTEWNKQTFEKCGVTVPITVKPHIFLHRPAPVAPTINGYEDDGSGDVLFYTIGELSDKRKNVEGTIRAFCETFKSTDKVKLLVKTCYKDFAESNDVICRSILDNLVSGYPDPPRIVFLTTEYSDQGIYNLHLIGDCFISLTHCEGWGLGAFDAHNLGNPVIITGFGGQLSYLGEGYDGLVDFDLVPSNAPPYFTPDQQWAEPDTTDASNRLLDMYRKLSG